MSDRAWSGMRLPWLTCVALGLLLASYAHASQTDEKLTILSYHEIADLKDALIPDYAVSPTMFVRQIDWLRNNGYHFVSMDDLLADKAGHRALPDKAVLITFDDGYRSMYEHAWPILKMLHIPSIVAVVGTWEEDQGEVNFDGHEIPRDKLMSWSQLRELSDSGLVEIASHSYDLHRGIVGNPQGNLEPAATTRRWLASTHRYEDDSSYRRRVEDDLTRSATVITRRIGRAPRIIAWPYGRYNATLRAIAARHGMSIGLTLDDGANMDDTPLWGLRRILVERVMGLPELSRDMDLRNHNLSDNDRAQKIMHVDLDYIYDPDPQQQEKNLGALLDRIVWLGVNTVYLQAFADPDGDGAANAVYFPNRHMPMRADLFNRVAWQIETRTPVKRVYAWMPTLAWVLPANVPGANDRVTALAADGNGHVNMGYRRLTPFSARARQSIREIYEDLGNAATFDGVLFHDDLTLSDFEDASSFGVHTDQQWGLPASVSAIRGSDDTLARWTILKINALDEFAHELAQVLNAEQPGLKTARNLYAQVVLNPKAEVWYSQALQNSLAQYDFTAIMAMPRMENAADPAAFYAALVARVKQYPGAMSRVVFELQTVDWRHDSAPIPTAEIAGTISKLYDMGVEHIAFYPDLVFSNQPDAAAMRAVFSTKPNAPQVH